MSKKKDKAKDNKDKKDKQDDDVQNAAFDKLQEDYDALQKDRDDLYEKLQRISADYANFQKRVPKQVADSVTYEKEKILKSLLTPLDSFEHALQNSETADNVKAVVEGIQIVYDQMQDVLKSHGVRPIDAAGETFDPSMHEAMMRQSDPEQEDNIVLQEFQKGYTLNDRVIRPSKVIVNKVETPERDDAEETDVEDTVAETSEESTEEV